MLKTRNGMAVYQKAVQITERAICMYTHLRVEVFCVVRNACGCGCIVHISYSIRWCHRCGMIISLFQASGCVVWLFNGYHIDKDHAMLSFLFHCKLLKPKWSKMRALIGSFGVFVHADNITSTCSCCICFNVTVWEWRANTHCSKTMAHKYYWVMDTLWRSYSTKQSRFILGYHLKQLSSFFHAYQHHTCIHMLGKCDSTKVSKKSWLSPQATLTLGSIYTTLSSPCASLCLLSGVERGLISRKSGWESSLLAPFFRAYHAHTYIQNLTVHAASLITV